MYAFVLKHFSSRYTFKGIQAKIIRNSTTSGKSYPVSIETSLEAGRPGFNSQQRQGFSLFATASS